MPEYTIKFTPTAYLPEEWDQLMTYAVTSSPEEAVLFAHIAETDVQVRTWALLEDGLHLCASFSSPEDSREVMADLAMHQIYLDEGSDPYAPPVEEQEYWRNQAW
jgi:hypothetical protein